MKVKFVIAICATFPKFHYFLCGQSRYNKMDIITAVKINAHREWPALFRSLYRVVVHLAMLPRRRSLPNCGRTREVRNDQKYSSSSRVLNGRLYGELVYSEGSLSERPLSLSSIFRAKYSVADF